MFAIGWPLGQQWKSQGLSLPHGIYIWLHRSTSNCPVTQLQCAEWGDMHRTRCPDLTYPGGSEKKHASRGVKGTRKQGETGSPGRGRGAGSSKEQGQLQAVKQALRTEDEAGTVCKVEIKWSHWKSRMGSTWTDFIPKTLRSLWKVWVREEHNHTYSFKIQSRGAFPSLFPHPHFHEQLFCSLYQGHCPRELQLSAFLSGAIETPIYLFSATERE